MSEYYSVVYSSSLSHHGVKGMKWGVRKQRIVSGIRRFRRKPKLSAAKALNKVSGAMLTKRTKNRINKTIKDYRDPRRSSRAYRNFADASALAYEYMVSKAVGSMSIGAHALGHHALGNVLALYGNYNFASAVAATAYGRSQEYINSQSKPSKRRNRKGKSS